ncbi:MAG: hypothetical protein CTY12_01945 [Methylotenera sp.]|nr:MAG: hypothetical protein CTY12_01945 [Methylotenera sp.]
MLSIKSSEAMGAVMEHAIELEEAMCMLTSHLSNLSKTLDMEVQFKRQPKDKRLSTEESARLLQLNRHLATLEDFLTGLADTIEPAIIDKKSDPNDPMADYEMEATLHYTLREDDHEWSDDSDNFLTTREVFLKKTLKPLRNVDFSTHIPENEVLDDEPP